MHTVIFIKEKKIKLKYRPFNLTTILYAPTAKYTEEEIEYFTAQCVRTNLNHNSQSESY